MNWIQFYVCLLFGEIWCSFYLPSDMKFGASSSASQIEGSSNVDGKTLSIIDTISEQNDLKIGEACKSYKLYKKDVKIAKEIGLQFYRFSISWSRILPNGFSNETNEAGVNYYNNLIDELLANGIEPAVTIFQYDLPQSLYDLGGWNNPNFKDWFGDYARVLFSLFGDRVKIWFTVNEPLLLCYQIGLLIKPQYESDTHLCPKNLLLAHAKAWRIYDEEFRKTQNGVVSIVNHIIWMEPASNDDRNLTELVRQYSFVLYSQPIYSKKGGWPKRLENTLASNENASKLAPLSDEEIQLIQGTYDFYALNYYTSKLVRKAIPGEKIGAWPFKGSSELEAVLCDSPDWQKTSQDWMTVNPEGLRKSLQWLNEEYGVTKFFISENGFPTSQEAGHDDDDRIRYITKHLEQLALAVNEDGIQVFGYSVWSIMDDFEFISKYTSKFGLYSVNFTDPMRTRTPRKSARFYRSVIHNVTIGHPIYSYRNKI